MTKREQKKALDEGKTIIRTDYKNLTTYFRTPKQPNERVYNKFNTEGEMRKSVNFILSQKTQFVHANPDKKEKEAAE